MSTLRPPRIRAHGFGVYYGFGPLPGLEQFDLVILEPAGWRASDLAALRSTGVRTLAYLSMLEATPETRRLAGLKPSDFLRPGGRVWQREQFGTVVTDPRSAAWRRFLATRLATLASEGWDGVFLDNLDDVEDPLVAADSSWLLPAAAELVRTADTAFHDRLVVQNNGLWLLLPLVAPYLDGICWEGDLLSVDMNEPWAQMTVERLTYYANTAGIVTMLLTTIEDGQGAAEKVAAFQHLGRRHGFLTYAAPADYAQAVRLGDGEVVHGR